MQPLNRLLGFRVMRQHIILITLSRSCDFDCIVEVCELRTCVQTEPVLFSAVILSPESRDGRGGQQVVSAEHEQSPMTKPSSGASKYIERPVSESTLNVCMCRWCHRKTCRCQVLDLENTVLVSHIVYN